MDIIFQSCNVSQLEVKQESVAASVYNILSTSKFNILEEVLYHSTGKLAPEKVIVVVPHEQVRKEGSRVSLHLGSEYLLQEY